ncbi:hypothetical protein GYMLUDRAFT_42083 [Collybiopsis luxurians FD-317 M1]|uniref:N-acetyltransferase domain-containing protein n=1 Tax=Collybiopsis luxurians FD-317 M1 TaxID=944289 RepID=A0A0D0CIW2_9AGAR|nr:hypothetical protein GYMLUDRAFT_42083 [Collybiopsis luxurians FD-317 M1]
MLHSVKDDNFYYPVPDVLETPKLKLVPFIPSMHAEAIIKATDTDTWHYMPFGPYSSAEEFAEKWYEGMRLAKDRTIFVGLDKTKLDANGHPTPAGLTGLFYTNPNDLWTEIFIMVLPQFRRTHVASHMTGLLLCHALNLPSEGGLGLRRVQWSANIKNTGSIGLAKKMGMKMEGIKRWARVLEPEKGAGNNGLSTRKGDPRENCPGRDTACLAICWDDWEDEWKERVESILMA